MALRIADVVAALDVVVGPDPNDIRSLPRPEASWPAALEDARPPAKVAWSPTLGYAPVDDEVRALCEGAVRRLEALGAEVVEIETVFEADPVRDWLTLAVAYNLRTLAPYRGHRCLGTGGPAAWPRKWTGPLSTSRRSTSGARPRTPVIT